MLLLITVLMMISIYFAVSSFSAQGGATKTHLPDAMRILSKKPEKNLDGTKITSWTPFSEKYKHLENSIRLPLDVRRMVVKAGSPFGVLEFIFFQVLSAVGIPLWGMILVGDRFWEPQILLPAVLAGVGLPWFWLHGKIKQRQLQIGRDLPGLIDLLNICVSGGLDFMMATGRVLKDMKPCDLTRELAEMQRETQKSCLAH
jgi:Flp pilus assembly protein TadB